MHKKLKEKSRNNIYMKEFTAQYLKASAHYGHLPKYWNPKMAPYILHEQDGYHIFDIAKSSRLLKIAGNALQKKAAKGGKFLFVGTSKASAVAIEKHARRSRSFYVNSRWLGGLLSNWTNVQQQVIRFKHLETAEKKGFPEAFSKKDANVLRKETLKLRNLFNGIKGMRALPATVIFASPLKNSLAVQECLKLGIPAISIVDTNCNPELVAYPIPANDDSVSSVDFILAYLADRILAGRKEAKLKQE